MWNLLAETGDLSNNSYGGGGGLGGGNGGGLGGGLGGVSHVSPDQLSTHTQNQCVPLYCNLSPPGGMHFGGSTCPPFTTRSPFTTSAPFASMSPTTCSSFEFTITFPPAFCTPTVPFVNRATGQLFARAKSTNTNAQQRNAKSEIAGRPRTRVIYSLLLLLLYKIEY